MKRGTFVSRAEADRTTLRELIHRYTEEVTPPHKGAASEQTRLATIVRSRLSESFVANLRPADFAAWRDLRLKSVAPATVVRELGMLQQVITHALARVGNRAARQPGEAGQSAQGRERPLAPAATGRSRRRQGSEIDITENAFKLAWQRAVKRAGLPGLHFHDLRHEAVSRLAEKLTNILELSSVTGHRDRRMLKRYYHPRPEELDRKLAG